MVNRLSFILITAFSLLPLNAAHDSSHVTGSRFSWASNITITPKPTSAAAMSPPSSYFGYGEFSGLLFAHILFMLTAWFVVLPVGIMLSVANFRSRLASITRLLFLGLNGGGIILGRLYNSRVPDLYAGNSHHAIGWILTWITLLQSIFEAIRPYAGTGKSYCSRLEEREALMPISAEAVEQHEKFHTRGAPEQYRYSHDSGHGTDQDSSRSQSGSSLQGVEDEQRQFEDAQDVNAEAGYHERRKGFEILATDHYLSRIRGVLSNRILRLLNYFHGVIDLLILPLGFIAIVSGMVVYGGVFRGSGVFNGLAHTIKGGIFFWYGLLTLGRWMGCFVEYGWAWNVRPPAGIVSSRTAAVPSAEFVESFVIFLYGSSNVFLEHLAAWGDVWTAQDLEHVSISAMFFGGGLCGMLLESQKIRDLLNTTILTLPSRYGPNAHINGWNPPNSYPFSMNPFPALIILLLGLLMSSHHQNSHVSTMIHKQWGSLLVGFALARACTYLVTYVSPPSSFLPSRPPTELVSSFCLLSGGIIFMASNRDTVAAMELYGLDAMFSFTLTMGFTAFLMAWTIIVLTIKGWAVRKQKRASNEFADFAAIQQEGTA